MGYHLGWIAVAHTDRDAVLERLGLRSTGAREEIAESKFVGVALRNGRYVVVDNGMDLLLDEDRLMALSEQARVIQCVVEEGRMSFAAAVYERGDQLWSVVRLAEDETSQLRIEGTPPASLHRIRDRYEAKQRAEAEDSVDWLSEVPVVLAAELSGYRHDEDPDAEGAEPFEVLERVGTSRRRPRPGIQAPRSRRRPARYRSPDSGYAVSYLWGGWFGVLLDWLTRRVRGRALRRNIKASRERRRRR